MWNKWKPYVGCLLVYVLITNLFLVFKQQNFVSLMTVPGIGLLSSISKSFVFKMSDVLGVFFYTILALVTAVFLFVPMLIYGFQSQRRWILLQAAILLFNVGLFYYK
jgi:hypothetical protein